MQEIIRGYSDEETRPNLDIISLLKTDFATRLAEARKINPKVSIIVCRVKFHAVTPINTEEILTILDAESMQISYEFDNLKTSILVATISLKS